MVARRNILLSYNAVACPQSPVDYGNEDALDAVMI